MSIKEILGGTGGILFIILTLIQITPIKINPWSWLLKWIGKQTQHETLEKLDAVQKDITSMKDEISSLKESDAQQEAVNCRYRILRFADECYLGQKHSLEHFKQILSDITIYESYCSDHPDFPNQVAVMSIDHIKSYYSKAVEQHDFLN